MQKTLAREKKYFTFADGEMAEWSNAAVLKTVEGHTSGGSNPSFSAKENPTAKAVGFLLFKASKAKAFVSFKKQKPSNS